MLKVKMLTKSWLLLQTYISLLNIDQQILSQSSAKIGPNIITPDQTGFITETTSRESKTYDKYNRILKQNEYSNFNSNIRYRKKNIW